jgi:hypothetical protein
LLALRPNSFAEPNYLRLPPPIIQQTKGFVIGSEFIGPLAALFPGTARSKHDDNQENENVTQRKNKISQHSSHPVGTGTRLLSVDGSRVPQEMKRPQAGVGTYISQP